MKLVKFDVGPANDSSDRSSPEPIRPANDSSDGSSPEPIRPVSLEPIRPVSPEPIRPLLGATALAKKPRRTRVSPQQRARRARKARNHIDVAALMNVEDRAKKEDEHDKLRRALADRGVVEGLLDLSTGADTKRVLVAEVFHDAPEKVLEYYLSESKVGIFRRRIIDDYDEEEDNSRHLVVYWQYYQGTQNKFVEVRTEGISDDRIIGCRRNEVAVVRRK
jgi:hypothetical protein